MNQEKPKSKRKYPKEIQEIKDLRKREGSHYFNKKYRVRRNYPFGRKSKPRIILERR